MILSNLRNICSQIAFSIALLLLSNVVLAKTHTVEQKDRSFMQEGKKVSTTQIKVGDKVTFKNVDSVFHNIYSMSEINKFNLGAFDGGQSETVAFNKAGIAKVKCAIHPRMIIKIEVSE